MADDGSPSRNYNEIVENSEIEDSERPQQLQLDLGDDLAHNIDNNAAGEALRRDDNPFSFKHFLQNSNPYQHMGARPKVYCEGRPIQNPEPTEIMPGRVVPEFSAGLPDFVQDHLVIEQCYLGPTNNFNLDMNLPDFAPSNSRISSHINNDSDLIMPMDLPTRSQFPLDLPLANSTANSRTNSSNEVGSSKSLPDFLADSAVRSTKTNEPVSSSTISPEETDPNRLRREIEHLRRQLAEQTRRADSLNRELEVAKNNEREYSENLAKALEQVEDNLEKSNRKANTSMHTILKLKQEIKSLNLQLNDLKVENKNLRGEASGGYGYVPPAELQSQRLAQDLRNAASNAEHSLRQLLTGVDNLRIMAASLENMHKIEEKVDYLDLDKDDSGPAL